MSPQARTGTAKADEDDEAQDAQTEQQDGDVQEARTEGDGSNAHSIPSSSDIPTPIEPGEGATKFMTAEEAEKAKEDDKD
jgi:hypothetical protein